MEIVSYVFDGNIAKEMLPADGLKITGEEKLVFKSVDAMLSISRYETLFMVHIIRP
jgi:hypothetical protein